MRWIEVESEAVHLVMKEVKNKKVPYPHALGRDAAFLYAHLKGWVEETAGEQIVANVEDNDGIEAWRKLVPRFNPQTAATKGARL